MHAMEHFESGIVCLITTSSMKLLIVIGSAWAYLSRNWCTIMWMFNITGIQFEVFVIGYLHDLHINHVRFSGFFVLNLVCNYACYSFTYIKLYFNNNISTALQGNQKTPQHHFWTQTCSLKRHFQFPDLLRIRLISNWTSCRTI